MSAVLRLWPLVPELFCELNFLYFEQTAEFVRHFESFPAVVAVVADFVVAPVAALLAAVAVVDLVAGPVVDPVVGLVAVAAIEQF